MARLKLILITLLTLFLLFIILSIFSGQTPAPPINVNAFNLSVSSRNFDLGFMAIPKQPVTAESWYDAFQLIKNNAEVVMFHSAIDWEKFVANSNVERTSEMNLEGVNFQALMAKQYGSKFFLVLDPLISNREQIDDKLPSSFEKNFGDPSLRQAFKNYAIRTAKDYRPEFMALGSEINTYLEKNPEDTVNLVSLIKETIQLIKQESPSTIVTTTFQYESLVGKLDGQPQWQYIADFSELDAISITTYPSIYFSSPSEIPSDYYSQIKQHTSKPIIIAESGWPTGGSSVFHGSASNQNEFLLRFPSLIEGLDTRLWVWWFLHDWKGEGYEDYFKTMGLRTSEGSEKISWQTWRKINSLPKV